MLNNLLNNCKVTRCVDAVAAGQAATAGTILDMQGYHGVMFVAALGAVTDGAVITLSAQQNDENSASGMATLAGTATYTAGASDADNNLLVLDVVKPRKRYVRPVFTSGTANAAKDGVIAIQYGPGAVPVVQGAGVLDHDTIADPEEA